MRFHSLFPLLFFATGDTTVARRLNAPSLNDPYALLSPLCAEPRTPPVSLIQFLHESEADPLSSFIDIPCGVHVVVPGKTQVKFNVGLSVSGKLSFEDNGEPIRVETPSLLVRGFMEIGSEAEPYTTKLNIVLTDGGQDLVIEDTGLGPYNPLTFNEKGFVVLGGKVTMVGATSDTYTHLLDTVPQGSKVVKVGKQVAWGEGDHIAIASSIIRGQFSSYGKIRSAKKLTEGMEFELEESVENSHFVRYFEKTLEKDKSAVYLRPEVIKLNRNIVISGSSGADGMGGYFVVSHSAEKQIIEGVEFMNMGQIGKDNRYPVQFAFNGYVPEGTRIAKNSIHHSLQRCVVIQATHDVDIVQNVAYHTHGHCFVTEDGIETGNKFKGNVAMHIVNPTADIDSGVDNAQSDKTASAFYMASPSNDITGNVVAGAYHTGFFYESHERIRGASAAAKLPGYDTINVKHQPFGVFANNLAHSVQIGVNPGFGRSPTQAVTFEGLTCWTVFDCWHSHSSHNLSIDHMMAVDFKSNGVSVINAHGFTIKNALLVGELNYPKECDPRSVAGIDIGSTAPFTLWNIHFQKLSKRTNCLDNNVAIQVSPTQGSSGGIIHSSLINLSYDESVDEYYNVLASPVVLDVLGIGAGPLPPNGAIITTDKIKPAKTCSNASLNGHGSGISYCMGPCWKSLVLEWTGAGDRAVYTSKNTGEEFSQLATQMEVNGNIKKSVTMTMPVGQYDFKLVSMDGKVVQSSVVKRYDYSKESCGGKIYANDA